jgi:hypothetical protein
MPIPAVTEIDRPGAVERFADHERGDGRSPRKPTSSRTGTGTSLNLSWPGTPQAPVAVIRGSLADGEDGASIRRLAALADSTPPRGAVMLAEVDGDPVAAVGIADGKAVADPARSTPTLIAQLRLQTLQIRLIGTVWGL